MRFSAILFLASIISLAGCEQDNENPPEVDANFSAEGYDRVAPTTIDFINTSKNSTTYRWNFGDGTFSTEKQPSHTYTLAGTYQVGLRVTGTGGTDTTCKVINIEPPFAANQSAFSYFLDKCSGYPVGAAFKSLNPASTGTVWDFNGVQNISRDPIIQFLVPGDYTIKYSSMINGIRDTVTRIIRIE